MFAGGKMTISAATKHKPMKTTGFKSLALWPFIRVMPNHHPGGWALNLAASLPQGVCSLLASSRVTKAAALGHARQSEISPMPKIGGTIEACGTHAERVT